MFAQWLVEILLVVAGATALYLIVGRWLIRRLTPPITQVVEEVIDHNEDLTSLGPDDLRDRIRRMEERWRELDSLSKTVKEVAQEERLLDVRLRQARAQLAELVDNSSERASETVGGNQ